MGVFFVEECLKNRKILDNLQKKIKGKFRKFKKKHQLKKNRFKWIPFWEKKEKRLKSILFFSNKNVYTFNIRYLSWTNSRTTTKNEITRTE